MKNMLEAASKVLPNPQYIIWTGDSMPHIGNLTDNGKTWICAKKISCFCFLISCFWIGASPALLGFISAYRGLMQAVGQQFQNYFPSAVVLPVLGEQDSVPPNKFPDEEFKTYSEAFNIWKRWLKDEQNVIQLFHWPHLPSDGLNFLPDVLSWTQWFNFQKTFAKGGYYKYKVTEKVTVLGLNTNLYSRLNPSAASFVNPEDPGGQLQFMTEALEDAKNSGGFVHIIAHMPPGGNRFFRPFLCPLPWNFAKL